MRKTYVDTLAELSRKDDKVVCVIGDTGFSVFEDYEKEFKSRFINVGIAEQNFVSFGAGLAAMGMKPYIYNVASFMVLRAAEQITLDICYQENPVRLVGVGGGFAYATAGPTHHSLQDIAIMSALPNMTVVCPGDPREMEAIMHASLSYEKPLYIRIGRSIDPVVHLKEFEFKIGKAIKMTGGEDATVFVSGTMLKEALVTCDFLKSKGLEISVYSVPTIKPIDEEIIIERSSIGKPIFTIEEHSLLGGLGDAVGRVILERNLSTQLYKFGVKDSFAPVTGSREYLLDINGLSPEKMVNRICEIVK